MNQHANRWTHSSTTYVYIHLQDNIKYGLSITVETSGLVDVRSRLQVIFCTYAGATSTTNLSTNCNGITKYNTHKNTVLYNTYKLPLRKTIISSRKWPPSRLTDSNCHLMCPGKSPAHRTKLPVPHQSTCTRKLSAWTSQIDTSMPTSPVSAPAERYQSLVVVSQIGTPGSHPQRSHHV